MGVRVVVVVSGMADEATGNEKMIGDTLAFVWRVRLLRQAAVTATVIATGYAFGYFVRDGGFLRLLADVRDIIRGEQGDTEAKGRLAGRWLGDVLSVFSRR